MIDYLQFNVIIKQKTISENVIVLPAVTFCIIKEENGDLFERILRYRFRYTKFTRNKFQKIHYSNDMDCYKANGGRNSSGDSIEILKSVNTGKFGGYAFQFNLEPRSKIYVFIGDAKVKGTRQEFTYFPSGAKYSLAVTKEIEKKLAKPYNDCYSDLKKDTINSPYVKEVLSQDIAYRKINCLELCNKKNETNSCESLCPENCDAFNYVLYREYYEMNEKMNGKTQFNIYFNRREYLLTYQAPTTTVSNFIANLAGLTGLILELSMLSFYRLISHIYNIMII